MTTRLIPIAVALATATALATSANAAPPSALPVEGATVTEMDSRGRPLGPPATVAAHAPGAADLQMVRAGARGTAFRIPLAAAGCRTIDAWRNSYTLFGFLAYRFHQVKYWCWSANRVSGVKVSTYVSDVDRNMRYRGIVSSASWYYNWCCSSATSGHYSMRQGKFENCPLHLACIGAEYPSVTIWAHSDGSYAYATSL